MRSILLLAVIITGGTAFADLGYVECSAGLQTPVLDGGRSELEFADIDDDGHVDILSIGDHGSPYVNTQEHGVMVWFGDGAGNWSVFQYGNFGYGGIAVGDVNGDGAWDIGYGMHHNYSGVDLGDQVLEVALGDGTGRTWTAWDDSLAREGQDWGMFATDFADIDNDGDLDVGSISFGADDGIHVYLNLGDGRWRRSFGFLGGNSEMEFYFRDVNRDGRPDMIAAHGQGSVWFGDGAGGFTPAGAGLPGSSYGLDGLTPGDIDNDGGCDVAFANDDGGVEVWVWDDSLAVWTERSSGLPASGDFEATALCDMDADGFLDVLALGDGLTKIWTGDGAGNWAFACSIVTPSPGYYSCLRVGADFDHNGRPDFAFWTREGTWPSDINVAHAFRETSPVESLAVFPVFPRGGEKFFDGSIQFVDWWSEAPGAESTRVALELSLTGPAGPWQPVADSLRNAGRYQWHIPGGIVSGDCRIRYTVTGPHGSATAVTPRSFAIGDTVVGLSAGRRWARKGPQLRLAPNPARAAVAVGPVTGSGRLEMFDVSGSKVRTWRLEGGTRTVQLDGIPVGAYVMRLVTGSGTATGRLVVGD